MKLRDALARGFGIRTCIRVLLRPCLVSELEPAAFVHPSLKGSVARNAARVHRARPTHATVTLSVRCLACRHVAHRVEASTPAPADVLELIVKGRPSRRPLLVRPRQYVLGAALGRCGQRSAFCQIFARLHVGGGQALRARGQK